MLANKSSLLNLGTTNYFKINKIIEKIILKVNVKGFLYNINIWK